MTTRMNAERTEPDGWREITVPAGTKVSIGEGWIVTVTAVALRCGCGKGLDCFYNTRERMNYDRRNG